MNVPIGLAALVVAWLRLRESRDPAASGVDLRGVALLCPALFLLVYALIRGNEEGLGERPHHQLLRGLRTAARAVRGSRSAAPPEPARA